MKQFPVKTFSLLSKYEITSMKFHQTALTNGCFDQVYLADYDFFRCVRDWPWHKLRVKSSYQERVTNRLAVVATLYRVLTFWSIHLNELLFSRALQNFFLLGTSYIVFLAEAERVKNTCFQPQKCYCCVVKTRV